MFAQVHFQTLNECFNTTAVTCHICQCTFTCILADATVSITIEKGPRNTQIWIFDISPFFLF